MADVIPTVAEGLWVRREFRYSGHEFKHGDAFKLDVGSRKIRNLYQSRFLMSTAEKLDEEKKRAEQVRVQKEAQKAAKKPAKLVDTGSDALKSAQDAARKAAQ